MLTYQTAIMREKPPVAPPTFGAPIIIVAPVLGILSRFATHSTPHLPAAKSVLCPI